MRRIGVLVGMLALALLALAPTAQAGDNFVATLSGDQEVPTRDTQAVGVATFKLREDGAALRFKVNVANLDNAVAAHIHCGAVGVNGPVGVTLFMGAPAGGGVNGTLAEGTITAPDPATGPAGSTWRRCWPRSAAAPPTSTCTPTTGWRRQTVAPGTSPAGRSAARFGSNPARGQSEEGPEIGPSSESNLQSGQAHVHRTHGDHARQTASLSRGQAITCRSDGSPDSPSGDDRPGDDRPKLRPHRHQAPRDGWGQMPDCIPQVSCWCRRTRSPSRA
jgi:hypothetical protein